MPANASSPTLPGPWRKSSRSETKACVEVAMTGRATLTAPPAEPDRQGAR